MIGRDNGVCWFTKLIDKGRRGFDTADDSSRAVPLNKLHRLENIDDTGTVIGAGKFPR